LRAGEHWAYREKSGAHLEEVRIIKLGERRRSQAFLVFLDPEQEALEAWRPIQRLVAPWDERDMFLAIEAALRAADAISPNLTKGEVNAILDVVGAADAESCVDAWVGDSMAMMRITDARRLSVKLGPNSEGVPSHPLSFDDKEGRVVPWPVTEWILRSLARRFPDECVAEAEECEDKIEEIRPVRLGRGRSLARVDPEDLKYMRELRETAETIRGWVNGSSD